MSGPASIEGAGRIPQACERLLAKAARSPRSGVALARRRYARAAALAPRERAVAAYVLGYALLGWERLDDAEPLLAEALAGFAGCGDDWLALDVRRAQQLLALLRGEGGADDWAALAEAYAARGDALSAARARMGQMIKLNLQGRARATLALAEHARPALEQRGSEGDRAWLLRICAVASMDVGDLTLAASLLDAAIELFLRIGQGGELAKTKFERSRVYEMHGDLAGSLLELEAAYILAKEYDLLLRIAFCEKNLGVFVAFLGEFDRGILFLLQAYDKLTRLKRIDYMAGCDLNLGNIAYYAGLFELAMAAYRRAEQVYTQLGWHAMLLLSRRNQAMILRAQGMPRASLAALDELLAQAEALDDRIERAEICLARGQALADLGAYEDALSVFADAERRFRDLDSPESVGECCLERGLLSLQRGDIAGAEGLLRRAEALLHQRPIYRWRVDDGLGRCAEARGQPQAALEHYRSASLLVARMRRRLSNEHASSGLFAQAQHMIARATALAWRQHNAALLLELAELQRSLALVAALREAQAREVSRGTAGALSSAEPGAAAALDQGLQASLERRLRNRRMRPASDDAFGELDLAQMRAAFQAAFPAGWTLLTYIPSGDDLLIVTMDAAEIRLGSVAYDQGLRRLLARATAPELRHLTYLGEGMRAPAWPTLSALGDRLIPDDVRRRLSPEHRLLIVAGAPLHGLPWAALRVGGGWLMQRATLQILPGLLAWRELQHRRPAGDAALLIGVGSFGGRAPEVPGALATLDLVERRWRGPRDRLAGAAATLDALLERAAGGGLRRYGLLHIASHGQLVPLSGQLAHIKLADGDLHYDEIAALDLSGALVVLAVCEGAAAEVLPGDELLSLSRAFLRAGAREVIASEWQLYDTAAPPLIGVLYDHLAAGYDGPTALARAQRDWLRRGAGEAELDDLAPAPFVWASLTALGAGTPPGE